MRLLLSVALLATFNVTVLGAFALEIDKEWHWTDRWANLLASVAAIAWAIACVLYAAPYLRMMGG